jgi:hypothetical protein
VAAPADFQHKEEGKDDEDREEEFYWALRAARDPGPREAQ